MIELNGRKLAAEMKERQRAEVAELGRSPRLLILRDNAGEVISKYVGLKKKYGEEIGVEVLDKIVSGEEMREVISKSEADGIIVQLPLLHTDNSILNEIPIEKDVDGLRGARPTATAMAIDELLRGYNIELSGKKIAVVGRGKLVGEPLMRMWEERGLEVTVFHRGSDLTKLKLFDIIMSATGQPRLILGSFVKPGAVVVDAGTASEGGVIVGDVDESVRERRDLFAITPRVGGVGPMTVACLFQNVILAAKRKA
ncbi:bifunctional 5,10-methylenetetrahydrofolate dehydrogenase/5,10-methenyltetrahydrofolate cyclohydrolase [Candidatus Saccharibacteria bacterium]|nr:bifunctional 5,10-methylenetetrahydrofolate dehydrogenase/5,10-methenyltetrahydrofolate cyclohydrolase [Candidatus Saccharibacteria bacterium]